MLVSQRDETQEHAADEIHSVGTAGIIHQLARAPDGTLRLAVQGIERVRVLEYTQTDPYFRARVEPAPDQETGGIETESLRRGGTRPVRAACPTDRRDAKRAGAGS